MEIPVAEEIQIESFTSPVNVTSFWEAIHAQGRQEIFCFT